jgi:hypothetical protein
LKKRLKRFFKAAVNDNKESLDNTLKSILQIKTFVNAYPKRRLCAIDAKKRSFTGFKANVKCKKWKAKLMKQRRNK